MVTVAENHPPGKPGRGRSVPEYRRGGSPPQSPPVGSGQADPRDPIALFRRLIEARRDHDVKGSLALRRELLALGWSISPTEPGRGAR